MHAKALVAATQTQSHLVYPFEVPAGTTRLSLDFSFEPAITGAFRNLLTLTLFSPEGFRGEAHRHEPVQHIVLSRAGATVGFLPGDIPAGQWQAVINVHLAQVDMHIVLSAAFDDADPGPALVAPAPAAVGARGPGWYRGDLHGHTFHSDASWSVADFVAFARAEKLDFVTLTDHNTTSALAELHSLASDDLLTLGGMELTTFRGHALALNVPHRVDWRVTPGQRDMADVAQEVEAAGGVFIIAHPRSAGIPVCTGCDWQYSELMPGAAHFVEVWNKDWDDPRSTNQQALALWYGWLNQGYRLFATAGSDIHRHPGPAHRYGRNVVYAEALSATAIFDAMRTGHFYLSRKATLILKATGADGAVIPMGGTAALPARVTVTCGSAAGYTITLIVDGQPHTNSPAPAEGTIPFDLSAGQWCVAELRDADGGLQAVTNPIFLA